MKVQDEIALIRKRLQHTPVPEKPRQFFDTGSLELNAVFGHRVKGIPWQSIIEMFGMESHGKSLTAQTLMRLALDASAYCIWNDFESSWDEEWANTQGLYFNRKPPTGVRRVALFQPYEGRFGKKGPVTLASAQVMFAEVEALIKYRHELYPNQPIMCVTDSIAALQTDADDIVGVEGRKMNTDMALAKFLGVTMKRWVRLCKVCNVIAIFINQLRINPMQMFGNPEYSPGGKALKFYAHARVKVKLEGKGSGRMLQNGKEVGIRGEIQNKKNKRGKPHQVCGYKYSFVGKAKFFPIKGDDGE